MAKRRWQAILSILRRHSAKQTARTRRVKAQIPLKDRQDANGVDHGEDGTVVDQTETARAEMFLPNLRRHPEPLEKAKPLGRPPPLREKKVGQVRRMAHAKNAGAGIGVEEMVRAKILKTGAARIPAPGRRRISQFETGCCGLLTVSLQVVARRCGWRRRW